MSNDVAVKDDLNQAMTTINEEAKAMAAAMADAGIGAEDLEIPKLMLMQPTSKYVGDDLARLGDIVNTMTMEVVGGLTAQNGPDRSIEIVPLKAFKTIRTYAIVPGGKPKFLRVEPFNEENAKKPLEGVEAGQPIKRWHILNFFVLLKRDIEQLEAFPAVLSFKSTGMAAGKQLSTHIFKMLALKQEPYSKSVTLSVRKEKKDDNTWAVYEVGKGTVLSPEHKIIARDWLAKLASLTVKIHEGHDDDAAEAPAPRPVYEPKEPSDSPGDLY